MRIHAFYPIHEDDFDIRQGPTFLLVSSTSAYPPGDDRQGHDYTSKLFCCYGNLLIMSLSQMEIPPPQLQEDSATSRPSKEISV